MQLVWYILKQLFTSVSVKVVDIYLHFGEQLLIIIPSNKGKSEHYHRKKNCKKIRCFCNHSVVNNEMEASLLPKMSIFNLRGK